MLPVQADGLRDETSTCRCECCALIELVSSLYKFLLGWSLIAVGVVGVVMLFCHSDTSMDSAGNRLLLCREVAAGLRVDVAADLPMG